jgi:radical SAM superfamily enzyme YgiQ (UPF0313 family)
MVPRASLARGIPPSASIGLVTLNAKYVHLALSLRYLRNAARAAGFRNVWLREFTIQMPAWKMAAELFAARPAVLGFSVYIWNREPTFALIELVKKQSPETVIVVGGPEVSFEAGPPTPYVDYVIAGEGERKWVELLAHLARGEPPAPETLDRWRAYGTDLPELTEPPYLEEDYAGLEHRLAYLETSRGCPYSCSFCLSALDKQVRFFDDAAVKAQIETLIARGARRIKFLDRTFNLRKPRVAELFRWLTRFEGVEFHFEVVGDLLDEPILAILDEAPAGMFQFEVGIQTADSAVLGRIQRRQHQERLFAAIRRLRRAGRVHLHADLIWGLPGETREMIRRSFEQAIALRPHQLQLGFLKFLPGAPIRGLIEEESYVFQERPPYEVIRHRLLSAEELVGLKRIEEVFDAYYNSGRFRFTLERLFEAMTPWEVFERLAHYFQTRGLLLQSHSLDSLFDHLLARFEGDLPGEELRDWLRLDYFFHRRAHRVPDVLMDPGLAENGHPPTGKRLDGNTALVPFRHRIALEGERARLLPSPAPVWYAFAYPGSAQGYFFRPELREVE